MAILFPQFGAVCSATALALFMFPLGCTAWLVGDSNRKRNLVVSFNELKIWYIGGERGRNEGTNRVLQGFIGQCG